MPYLPLLAFPFVKLFQNNQLICFEVVATLISKYLTTAPLLHLGNLEGFTFRSRSMRVKFRAKADRAVIYRGTLQEMQRGESLRQYCSGLGLHLLRVGAFHGTASGLNSGERRLPPVPRCWLLPSHS